MWVVLLGRTLLNDTKCPSSPVLQLQKGKDQGPPHSPFPVGDAGHLRGAHQVSAQCRPKAKRCPSIRSSEYSNQTEGRPPPKTSTSPSSHLMHTLIRTTPTSSPISSPDKCFNNAIHYCPTRCNARSGDGGGGSSSEKLGAGDVREPRSCRPAGDAGRQPGNQF